MVHSWSVVAAASWFAVAEAGSALDHPKYNHGYRRSGLPNILVGDATQADELVAEERLPKAFDWRNVNGKNFATTDWNQHIPQYCGACWIHGTTSALNDRIKVLRGAAFPDVMLGRQAITNCVPDPSNKTAPPPGCDGGDTQMIHKYLHENKVPDETCMPYQARNMGCQADTICRNCLPGDKGCWPVKNFIGYGVSSYGNVTGEKAMMKEIYARGPIACSFATDGRFMMNYTEVALKNEGVYTDSKNFTVDDIDHVMEVAGWGETASGQKYWVVRNSWGTYWGSAGWLKLAKGVNMLLSESDCGWAVPTWDDLDEALVGKVMGDYVQGLVAVQDPLPAVMAAAPGAFATADKASVFGSDANALLIVGGCFTGYVAIFASWWWGRTRAVHSSPLLG